MSRALLGLLLLLAGGIRAEELRIGVVEGSVEEGMWLVAAAEAAAAALGSNASVVLAPVEPDEPLSPPAQLCELGRGGVAAVLSGATAGDDADTTRAARLAAEAAARAGVPLLLLQPAPASARWAALRLYPSAAALARAGAELAREKGWRRAVLLHAASAHVAAELAPDDDALELQARQLPPHDDDGEQLRNLLLVLKKAGATNFIVWCSAPCAERVLEGAMRVGLLGARHGYLVLAPELHTRRLQAYSYGGANITALTMFNESAAETSAAIAGWRSALAARDVPPPDGPPDGPPPTSVLLAYDAITIVVRAHSELRLWRSVDDAPSDCDSGAAAFHADSLLNYIRSGEWNGTTGALLWEASGERRALRLRVTELARGGRLEHAGVWSEAAGVQWERPPVPPVPLPPGTMTNRTFTILIAMNPPYVMRRESKSRLAGNDRYEGFCIELIEKLAEQLQFNYTFEEQPDGAYGSRDANGKWDGMIARLMNEEDKHFAITDLTITAEREQAVDFTTPFMNLGISILFRKPKPPEPKLFAFMLPFSTGVWLCLGVAYLGTSLLLYIVGRLCPEEWQNPYPCIEEPLALENQFTLANALWFNLGAVLLQGSEIAPVAYGTRAVASSWWLFALVITSSYTANLATLLAQKTPTYIIHDVKELAYNDLGIKYGAKMNGSTYTFFKNSQSQNELYRVMFEHMQQNEMPNDNAVGIQKVIDEEEKYAFLMESTTIEYTTERVCEVTKIGDLLDSKGYGIAMKKNSEYRQALNLALLNLQERGVLREMKHTWWKEKHGGGACKEEENTASQELKINSFEGLFLVLGVGCALGVAASCAETAWLAWRRPREPARPFGARFASELRFVFRLETSVKPLHGPLTPSPSPAGSASTRASDEPGSPAGGGSAPGSAPGTGPGTRRESAQSPPPPPPGWRRRSSMHNASVRLARHARADATPTR